MKLHGEKESREYLTVTFDVQYREQIALKLPRKVSEYFADLDLDTEVIVESIEVTKYVKPYSPGTLMITNPLSGETVTAKDSLQWHVKVLVSKPLEFEHFEREVSVETRTGYQLK